LSVLKQQEKEKSEPICFGINLAVLNLDGLELAFLDSCDLCMGSEVLPASNSSPDSTCSLLQNWRVFSLGATVAGNKHGFRSILGGPFLGGYPSTSTAHLLPIEIQRNIAASVTV
jgi:hypothetical protein